MGSPPTTPPRVMRGADGSNAGASGYAPAPAATDNNKALFGDAQWRAVSGTGTAATKAEADAGTDTTKYVAPDALSYALAAKRNALAPRGGLAFDGSAGRIYATTQTIGTDSFSVHQTIEVPTAAVAGSDPIIWAIGTSSDPVSGGQVVAQFIGSGDFLYVGFMSGADYRIAKVSSFCATYGGKRIALTVTRAATTVLIYVNGVVVTQAANVVSASPPSFGMSITGTYFAVGASTVGFAMRTVLYSASLYNLALSASDVLEIYELGGAVPERYKFGSQALLNTGNFVAEAFSPDTLDGVSATGFHAIKASGDARVKAAPNLAGNSTFLTGTQWLVSLSATLTSGAVPSLWLHRSATGGTISNTVVVASGANSFVLTAAGNLSVAQPAYFMFTTSGATEYTIASFRAIRLGAVVHYDADLDGIGYQLHDQSTNKLDAVLTTTGVSWTKPANRGFVRGTLTWAGTHEAKYLTGATTDLPRGAFIEYVSLKSSAATTGAGCSVGRDGAPATFLTAKVLTTDKAVYSPERRTPDTNNDGAHKISVDPDSNNLTAAVQIQLNYAQSEGTSV